MGISSYIVWESRSPLRADALKIYTAQLAVNFVWPLLFFGLEMFGLAFFWLILLWVLAAMAALLFHYIDETAGLLMLPYLIWLGFAAYLNIGIWLLNR